MDSKWTEINSRKKQVNKNDRRVKKTNRLLREELIKLLAVKDIEEITVKELTEAADVNRSTFYFYYQDIYDMVRQMQNEIYDMFYSSVINTAGTVDNAEDYIGYIRRFFDFCKENEMQCKFVLRNGINNELTERIKDAVKEHIPDSKKVFALTSPARYLTTFAISGITGSVIEWIEDGMPVDPQDMAQFVIETYILGSQITKKNEI